MVYGPIGHSWAEWKPKGPARRFTGEEVTERVLGRCAPLIVDLDTWMTLEAPWRPKDPVTAAIYDVVMENPPVFRATLEEPQ